MGILFLDKQKSDKEVIFVDKKNRWVIITIVAAVVAALTTVVVFVLRARAKKRAWFNQEAFDYDVDDCDCIEAEDAEEAVVEE